MPRKRPDYALLARLVIREGKPFNASALEAGYSEAVAGRGLRALVAESVPAAEAIAVETKAVTADIGLLKPLAIRRLHAEITDFDSPNGMKAIELAGRFKETDWFVRNSETNIGIFAAFVEPNQAPENAKTIDVYKE